MSSNQGSPLDEDSDSESLDATQPDSEYRSTIVPFTVRRSQYERPIDYLSAISRIKRERDEYAKWAQGMSKLIAEAIYGFFKTPGRSNYLEIINKAEGRRDLLVVEVLDAQITYPPIERVAIPDARVYTRVVRQRVDGIREPYTWVDAQGRVRTDRVVVGMELELKVWEKPTTKAPSHELPWYYQQEFVLSGAAPASDVTIEFYDGDNLG